MRIASLSPAATEILFALGIQRQIVCRDQFSNFPEEAKKIPPLRGHTDIDLAELRRFQPDIVLTGTVIQEKLSAKLREVGFTVVHQNPRTLFQVFEAIEQLGILFDREKAARSITSKMQEEFLDIQRKAKLLPRRPRVYIEEWHDPPFASGNWVPEIARIAGGEQIIVRAGELSRKVTLEEVRAADPDLIVISWCGAGRLAPKKLLMERPGWQELCALKEGAVRVIDDSLLNRPGPRLTEGARRLYAWIFEHLHATPSTCAA